MSLLSYIFIIVSVLLILFIMFRWIVDDIKCIRAKKFENLTKISRYYLLLLFLPLIWIIEYFIK